MYYRSDSIWSGDDPDADEYRRTGDNRTRGDILLQRPGEEPGQRVLESPCQVGNYRPL